MIATGTAILGAAALGAAGSIATSAAGASAAKKAGDLGYKASQEGIASQEKMYNQTRADNEPFRQMGLNAGSALSGAFGLSGAPTMTGGTNYAAPANDGNPYDQYEAANPDLAAEARRVVGSDPRFSSTADYYAWHDANYANEGRSSFQDAAPVAQPAAQTAATPSGAQPGYTDPTATGGYTMTPRAQMAPLNISTEAFKESPGYQFSLNQGNKALGNIASASRGLMSGQRMKAASEYNVGMADQEFGNWRDYTTNQYNNDRNFNEAVYQADQGRLDQRYDQRNNTLLQMAGFGSAANAANQSAAQSFANNSANLSMAGAQAKGNAGINAANAWGQGLNNLMTTGAYLGGQYFSGGSAARMPTANGGGYVPGYSPSWMGS